MKRSSLALVVVTLLTVAGTSLSSQNQAPRPAQSRAEEKLERWNEIGGKLVAMARDFPEDKYDYKLQEDQRTFAANILHVAAVDYDLMRSASGSNVGPDFGKNKHNPSRDVYQTKADVVKLIQQAVADGANPIKQQGDAGLDQVTTFAWGNKQVHNSRTWAGRSNTAASTTDNLWSITARTTWCRRTRDDDASAGHAVFRSSRKMEQPAILGKQYQITWLRPSPALVR